jgi:hypothetical protein
VRAYVHRSQFSLNLPSRLLPEIKSLILLLHWTLACALLLNDPAAKMWSRLRSSCDSCRCVCVCMLVAGASSARALTASPRMGGRDGVYTPNSYWE